VHVVAVADRAYVARAGGAGGGAPEKWAALLQRLRTAAGPALTVRRGDPNFISAQMDGLTRTSRPDSGPPSTSCRGPWAPAGAASKYEEPRPGDVRHSHADVSAAGRELGFRPEVCVEEGLRLALDWFGR
jgi:hypothetical protein